MGDPPSGLVVSAPLAHHPIDLGQQGSVEVALGPDHKQVIDLIAARLAQVVQGVDTGSRATALARAPD